VLSKAIIAQVNLTDEVELMVTKDGLLVKPLSSKRKDWEAKFKKVNKKNYKPMLDEFSNEFDKKEWTW
jgi:antitoxin MazE